MTFADLLWLAGSLLGLAALIVVPRLLWYVLVRYRQQSRYAQQVRTAESLGVPLPDPPPPPDLWRVQYRFGLIGGTLGLIGGILAIVVLIIGSHR